MQPTIIIRPRRPSDLASCAALLAQVYEKDKYPVQGVSRAEEFLSSPTTLCAWVTVSSPARISNEQTKDENTTTSSAADSENQEKHHKDDQPDEIIGHVALSLSPSDPAVSLHRSLHPHSHTPLAVLERLFVSPSARGRGVAEALMRAVSAEAARRGVRVVLFALVKDEGAMRLYQRVGWREFGRTEYGYQDGEGRGREMEAVCFVGPEFESAFS